MAPTKTLELCNKVTTQGNSISIRMLEYLSSAKNPVHGVQTLATEFLELSRLIWSIEAGLTESSHKRNAIPAEVTQELDKQFRRINDEFIVVNQMMLKFLDNENKKGGFGRAFRMMFADTDVDKIRNTLMKSRDQLKMSSAMFRWSLGDAKADSQMGIGYTGLIAALERLNPGRSNILLPMQPPPNSSPPDVPSKQPSVQAFSIDHRSIDHGSIQRAPLGGIDRVPSHNELPRPHTPLRDRPSIHDFRRDDKREDSGIASGITDIQNHWRAPSVRSSTSVRDTMYQHNGQYHGQPGYGEHSSDDSVRSRAYIDDDMHHLSIQERYSHEQAHSRQSDGPMGSNGQWAPRQQNGSMQSGGKGALADAVYQKKHRILEQMLEGGARADPRLEANMLRTAVQNRDADSLALLLRYGANADGLDKDDVTPLLAAVETSFYEGAKLLLKAGADPNLSAGSESESSFCKAACDNRIDLVQLMLAHGGDPGLIMENGNTALVQCMNKTVSPRLVELLLKSGGDANAKNGEGTTALFQAIQANRVDLMTVLLDNGANPNLPGPKHPLWPSTYKPKALQLMLARGADCKKTPGIMELASSLKKLESIQILMQSGVSPNVRKDGIYTPLCSAIRDNSADIVTYLLEHGADPNLNAAEYPAFKCITHNRVHFLPQLLAAGVDLRKPKGIIETAVAHNNKDALLWLLEQGVSPNDRSPEGNTPLTTAIRDERIEMVDLLLANGADPAIRGADWPLCMAVKHPAILKKLLAATPNPRAFRGIIEMAVVANQLESIKMLLSAGISVEDKNCGVFSPLTTAIRERHKHIVRYLLDEANADPNAPGEHLPLVKALRRLLPGDTEILQMLLTRGADINKMHRGWNAILQAVENGDADILRMLIEKGGSVDLQAINEDGRPVIDLVSERGWEEGLALLFPNAQTKQKHSRSLSLSSWRWITDAVAKDYEGKVMDEDDCRSQSSGPLPESKEQRKSRQLEAL
ncbi:ankyrin repeat domain containing protein [Paraphaeosphaeria sporulosa]